MTDRTPEQHAEALRARAQAGRLVAFRTDFYALPQVVQDALYGIAAELEDAADALAADTERLREPGEVFLRAYVDASVADGEGLLAAVDQREWSAMWQRVDEAAQAFGAALASLPADTEQP